jgi:uncharacterized protein YneF (UPF0154 family)
MLSTLLIISFVVALVCGLAYGYVRLKKYSDKQ